MKNYLKKLQSKGDTNKSQVFWVGSKIVFFSVLLLILIGILITVISLDHTLPANWENEDFFEVFGGDIFILSILIMILILLLIITGIASIILKIQFLKDIEYTSRRSGLLWQRNIFRIELIRTIIGFIAFIIYLQTMGIPFILSLALIIGLNYPLLKNTKKRLNLEIKENHDSREGQLFLKRYNFYMLTIIIGILILFLQIWQIFPSLIGWIIIISTLLLLNWLQLSILMKFNNF